MKTVVVSQMGFTDAFATQHIEWRVLECMLAFMDVQYMYGVSDLFGNTIKYDSHSQQAQQKVLYGLYFIMFCLLAYG